MADMLWQRFHEIFILDKINYKRLISKIMLKGHVTIINKLCIIIVIYNACKSSITGFI